MALLPPLYLSGQSIPAQDGSRFRIMLLNVAIRSVSARSFAKQRDVQLIATHPLRRAGSMAERKPFSTHSA